MNEEPYIFKSPGRLIVDPKPVSGNWRKMYEPFWMMVIIPGDICDYYRFQMCRRYNLSLLKPGWGSHISIISGETIFESNYDKIISTTKYFFKKNNRAEVEDLYLHLLDKGLVRLEELANWENLKRKYHKKIVEFEYAISPKTDGKYWWLRIQADQFKDIREEFGYPRSGYWGFHLTLGIPHPLHVEHSKYIWNNYKKFNWIY